MRCKKHPTDYSSSVGVCATCLRERLLSIMAVQIQSNLKQSSDLNSQPPPPISFPRSVSPYISRRKSDTATWQSHPSQPRFYTTPLVGPTGSVQINNNNSNKKKKKKLSSMFKYFFRSKSDLTVQNSNNNSSSPSWISELISGRRRKNTELLETPTRARTRVYRDRGMSPERRVGEEDEHCVSSGYSSDSGWKQTPRRTPANNHRRGNQNGGRNVSSTSGLTFCLSPLVRASPSRNWKAAPEMTEGTATSFCKNRSRKLKDFGGGRYTYN